MDDRVIDKKRSLLMSRVRSKDTKPELSLRSLLHRSGFRFRLHKKNLPGKPDIVLPKYDAAIFVDGCFWHQHPGCPKARLPKTNLTFWKEKLRSNVSRDRLTNIRLRQSGWRVIRVWECNINKDPTAVMKSITADLFDNALNPAK